MRATRKLFLAIAALIVLLGLLFVFIVQFVLRDSLYSMMEVARKQQVAAMHDRFAAYYNSNADSWNGVQSFIKRRISVKSGSGLVLRAGDSTMLGSGGTIDPGKVVADGLRKVVRDRDGDSVGVLYLYDSDIAEMSQWRKSAYNSTLIFMGAGIALLMALALMLAYGLSKRMTAPLKLLLAAIHRLRRGELGAVAPVVGKDEYGEVAAAFNEMSRELQHAEHVRRSLVADVAHELRTPLTIMRGKLELFQQNKLPVQPAALLPIQDELLRLTTLVEELHQIALAEARKLPMEPQPVDVGAWAGKVADNVREEAALHHIGIVLRAAETPVVAAMDVNRMTQVLMNLLGNALRHTPEGGTIEVEVSLSDADEGTGLAAPMAAVAVRDTGAGIAAEHLPYLFDRFYRADDDRSRERGGMGLGLAIARQFVEAHGGDIRVSSAVGEGTTFVVRIPLADSIDMKSIPE